MKELYSFWEVEFMGRYIKMPMSNWPQALTIAAYDPEVIIFYEWLLRKKAVKRFVDIGANFGTHSYLFASQGLRVMAVEPNPECVQFIRQVDFHNQNSIRILQKAVSREEGFTNLFFPPDRSWMGIIGQDFESAFKHKVASDPSCPKLKADEKFTKITVPVTKLDSQELGDFAGYDDGQVLLKIDVEGFEFEVMEGGKNFIFLYRPIIVFECFDSPANRISIYNFLTKQSYAIFLLSFKIELVGLDNFIMSNGTNFAAIPMELDLEEFYQ